MTPPGLTCCRCSRDLYPHVARHTPDGWRHKGRCPNVCTIEGCTEPHKARGYCSPHYSVYVLGRKLRRVPAEMLEDIEWMAVTGESWEGAAMRLGLTVPALERFLYGEKRHDLVAALKGREVAVAWSPTTRTTW